MTGDLPLVRRLVAADQGLAVVSTTRPDGTVQLVPRERRRVRPSADEPARRGPRRPRRGLQAQAAGRRRPGQRRLPGGLGVGFGGGPGRHHRPRPSVRRGPGRPDPQLLRDIFTAAGSTHDDWAEYDRVMADERRTAVFVSPARITTNG